MNRIAVAALTLVLASSPAFLQEKKAPTSWNGSISPGVEKDIPNSQSAEKAKVLAGVFLDAATWEGFWKKRRMDAPKVDFEKQVVVTAVNMVYDKHCSLSEAKVDDRGVARLVVNTGTATEKKSMKCHYEFSMQALSRKDLKSIEIRETGREKGDPICILEPRVQKDIE